jgi:thiol-disulfide isomerase/thioredoxin
MKQYIFGTAVLFVVSGAVVFAQSAAPSNVASALALLERVAQHYADAKSYHIESVEERTTSNALDRSWQKIILSAAESRGNRYRYEGHSGQGSALRVSDGKTVWDYRFDEKRYTAKPMTAAESGPRAIFPLEFALVQAQGLRKTLADMPRHYKFATQLPDEVLSSDGREVSCYVVRVRTADMKRAQPEYSFEKTIWIDKARETILKMREQAHTYLKEGNTHIPYEEETTTIYTLTELDGEMKESLFVFAPPSEAKLVEDFPDPRKNGQGPDMTGQTAPSLKLASSDGKVISLDSFRGKPVLLYFWATWCPPCVKGLSKLAQLRKDTKERSLVFISIDQDEEGKTAADFLVKNEYDWANFHDDDGEVDKSLGSSSIPRTILIDPQGKIIFDRMLYAEGELRDAVAKLGPEYASVALTPQPNPCLAPK